MGDQPRRCVTYPNASAPMKPVARIRMRSRLCMSTARAELIVRPLPFVLTRWFERLGGKRYVDHCARFRDRSNRTGSYHLHGDVAESSRFHGPCDYPATGRVRRELIQHAIAGSPADNPHLIETLAGERL